jgi:two-component sensor histidine kinase
MGPGSILDTRTERGIAYAIALLLVLIAALARWGLELVNPLLLPFTAFYPAVLFASYIGGFRVGIFAAVLGALIGWWVFLPPQFAFFPLDLDGWLYILSYVCVCAFIIWGAGSYRNLAETSQKLAARLQDEEDFRTLALEELSHRLKNKVSTIMSIISYPLQGHQKIRDEITSRLVALSATDDLILKAHGSGASIIDIVSAELSPYEISRITFDGPNIRLEPKLALMMALLLHELATNAAKYGALSNPTGTVSISWSVSDSILEFHWSETGGPTVSEPTRKGFGLRLLSRALDQFNGNAELEFRPSGLECRMKASLPPFSG